jgi:uncharacterized protein with NRDE domain
VCLILFAAGACRRYPLVVAANRDEAYGRPAAPAGFWPDHPEIFGGRDLDQGGTWLGITREARFAAVTNYRQAPAPPAPRSRGELTRNFLAGRSTPEDYLQEVAGQAGLYRGFSLIVGRPEALWFYSNRGGELRRVSPGVHGLSNHLLDEPWPKVRRGVEVLSRLISGPESALVPGLFDMLSERTWPPDAALPTTGIPSERERDLSPAFIADSRYGTRASTVLLLGHDGEIAFFERSFGPEGRPIGEVEQRFRSAWMPETRPEAPAQA